MAIVENLLIEKSEDYYSRSQKLIMKKGQKMHGTKYYFKQHYNQTVRCTLLWMNVLISQVVFFDYKEEALHKFLAQKPIVECGGTIPG